MRKVVLVREMDADVWRKIKAEAALNDAKSADFIEMLWTNWEWTEPDDRRDSVKIVRDRLLTQ